jgi:hypothetical protein
MIPFQKEKAAPSAKSLIQAAFVYSATFPGNHLIPPEGFRFTAFGGSLTINEKNERHRTDTLIYCTVTSYLSMILILFNIFYLV